MLFQDLGTRQGSDGGTVSPTAAWKRALTRKDAELIAQRVIALARRGDSAALYGGFKKTKGGLGGRIPWQGLDGVRR